jgi:uncharacterized protein YcbK (DUF882 family)
MSWARTVATPHKGRSWLRPRAVFERTLSFRHRHTGEHLTTVYYADGRYLPESLASINRLLRDFRTDEVKDIDPALLDLMYVLQSRLESAEPFEVYSAYRSPETNASLIRRGGGAARNSLHMRGMAVDTRIEGVDAPNLFKAALSLQRGGVGYYGQSSFVHLDVGDVRSWRH